MKKETREILLDEATKLFAEKGFYATTTREIVNGVGKNISTILYYFDGKEGLYKAVLENVAFQIKDVLEYELKKVHNFLSKDELSEIEAEECLCSLINTFCQIVYSQKIQKDMIRIFLSEYQNPSKFFPILQEGIIHPILSFS